MYFGIPVKNIFSSSLKLSSSNVLALTHNPELCSLSSQRYCTDLLPFTQAEQTGDNLHKLILQARKPRRWQVTKAMMILCLLVYKHTMTELNQKLTMQQIRG